MFAGVFTELIQRFGVKGASFREFYSLDDDSFRAHQPLCVGACLFPPPPPGCRVPRDTRDRVLRARRPQIRPHLLVPMD